MKCKKCGSTDIVEIFARCKDMCCLTRDGVDYGESYVRSGLNLGCGDEVDFKYCGQCGQMVGNFPLKKIDVDE